MKKAVYFDLDGVLFDRDQAESKTLEYINKFYLNNIEQNELFQYWKDINAKLWEQCNNGYITAEDVLVRRWSKIIDHVGLKNIISPETLSEIYIDKYTNPLYMIDLTHILNKLKSEKYFLAIITNGVKRIQHLKINKMALDKYFDHIVTDQDSGYRKPDVRMFEYAMSLHQINSDELIYIGDSYTDDIVPAQQLGITAILYGCNSVNNSPFYYKATNEMDLQIILNNLLG